MFSISIAPYSVTIAQSFILVICLGSKNKCSNFSWPLFYYIVTSILYLVRLLPTICYVHDSCSLYIHSYMLQFIVSLYIIFYRLCIYLHIGWFDSTTISSGYSGKITSIHFRIWLVSPILTILLIWSDESIEIYVSFGIDWLNM